MEESVRTIDKKYLVISEKGPLTMAANKNKAKAVVKMAEEKGIKARLREVFLPVERMESLGVNLFKTKLPCEANEIMEYRNKVITAFHSKDPSSDNSSYIWKKVSQEYDINGSLDNFNQYCLDILEYYSME
jgi:hypothetical protein